MRQEDKIVVATRDSKGTPYLYRVEAETMEEAVAEVREAMLEFEPDNTPPILALVPKVKEVVEETNDEPEVA